MSRQSKSEEVVMAGDGGRVPDVSEPTERDWLEGLRYEDKFPSFDDPASVLAALLAESPEATVAAIEALLTSERAVEAARERTRYWLRDFGALDNHSFAAQEHTVRAVTDDVLSAHRSAACRSLLSKAPKEDRDA